MPKTWPSSPSPRTHLGFSLLHFTLGSAIFSVFFTRTWGRRKIFKKKRTFELHATGVLNLQKEAVLLPGPHPSSCRCPTCICHKDRLREAQTPLGSLRQQALGRHRCGSCQSSLSGVFVSRTFSCRRAKGGGHHYFSPPQWTLSPLDAASWLLSHRSLGPCAGQASGEGLLAPSQPGWPQSLTLTFPSTSSQLLAPFQSYR